MKSNLAKRRVCHSAGNAAAERLATEQLESGVVLFPKGMDANDCARKVSPAETSLGLLLQQAECLGKRSRPGVTTVVTQTPQPAAKKEVRPVELAAPLLPAPAAGRAPEPEPVATEGAAGE